MKSQIHQNVQEYYGQVLKTKADLQTSACCPTDAIPRYLQSALSLIADEIQERFYGCGSPIPLCLEGATVLDLGCGTGRDLYLISRLVGESGHAIGVDMTPEQLEVARKYQAEQARVFGHSKTNVTLHEGYMEELDQLGIEAESVDVVVSNCVVNLAPDKMAVFKQALKALKVGGEIYFSDVFADRRLPVHMREDPVLVGECLGGALYIEDFRRLLSCLGINDYRIVSTSQVLPSNPELEDRCGNVRFYSMTVRAFKLPALEDRCEDYGQVAQYLGTIPHAPNKFVLDDHHTFYTGKPEPVCSNTAMMLSDSRFGPHFKVLGDTDTHFGLFDCGPNAGVDEAAVGECC